MPSPEEMDKEKLPKVVGGQIPPAHEEHMALGARGSMQR